MNIDKIQHKIYNEESKKGDRLAFIIRNFILITVILMGINDAYYNPDKIPHLFAVFSNLVLFTLLSLILKKKNLIKYYYSYPLIILDIITIGIHHYFLTSFVSPTASVTSASIFLYFIFILISSLSFNINNIIISSLTSLIVFNTVYFITINDIPTSLISLIVSADRQGQIFKSFYIFIFSVTMYFSLKKFNQLVENQSRAIISATNTKETLNIEKKHKKLLENRLELIISNLKGEYFFFSHNKDGKINYTSPSIKNVLGYSPYEFTGNIKDYLPENKFNKKAYLLFNKGYNVKDPAPYEVEIITKGKNTRILEILEIPLRDDKNTIISVEGIAHDITVKKQYEEKLKKSEMKMKEYARRIAEIREEEKKALSADLHDELGTMAVSIGSNLKLIKEEIKDDNKAESLRLTDKTNKNLTDYISNLKNIAKELRPPNMEVIGIAAALQLYFENVEEEHKIRISFNTNIDSSIIPDYISISLYRIAQEGITNVLKYSEADHVSIKLKKFKNRLEFKIKDNGIGFDTQILQSSEIKKIGITGMKERVEALSGKFRIKSALNKGCEIIIEIPYN
ncbi:MAG: ATP-binding protein [Candidatus Muiribacteriota bacterium]